MAMRMSAHGRKILTQLEGKENMPYKDSAGLLTVGVGHLLTQDELSSGKIFIRGAAVKYGYGLTDQQIDDLLDQDLERFNKAVSDYVTVPLDQGQFDSLVSFSFNVGTNAFKNSTLLKELNKGHYNEVPNQLRRWVYSGGQKVQGLVNRRETEVKLWNGEI